MPNSTLRTCILLFFLSTAFFLIRITAPPMYSFDEIMYVPPAKAYLETGVIATNQAHPPLAQLLITLSMRMFGDKPLGWRFLSSIFGGLTVAGVYAWGIAVMRRRDLALWITLLAMLNQMLLVLSRTGQLDIFVMCFMTWGAAAFCAAWTRDIAPRRARLLLIASGAMLGLMTACKWLGIVALGGTFALVVFAMFARRFAPQDERTAGVRDEPWLSSQILPGVGIGTVVIALVIVPLVTYAAAHLPLLFFSGPESTLRGIIENQLITWHNHTSVNNGPWHPPKIQMSEWYQWPVGWRPVWFSFDRAGSYDHASVVLLTGNPIVLWGGLIAMGACVWLWIKERSRKAFLALVWYAILWLSWAVVPIKTGFLYYYAPAVLALGPALGVCVERWPDYRLFRLRWYQTFAIGAAILFIINFPTSTAIRVPLSWVEPK